MPVGNEQLFGNNPAPAGERLEKVSDAAEALKDKDKAKEPDDPKAPKGDDPDDDKKNGGLESADGSGNGSGRPVRGRPGKYVPVPMYQRKKDEWNTKERELQEQIQAKDQEINKLHQQLQNAGSSAKIDDVVKRFSEKHKADPELVRELAITLVKEGAAKSTENEKRLAAMEERERQREWDNIFSDEYREEVVSGNVPKGLKAKIKKIYFSEEGRNMSVFEIYHKKIKPKDEDAPRKHGIEGGTETHKGMTESEEALLDSTPEERAKWGDDKFMKYRELQRKRQGGSDLIRQRNL